MSKYEIVRATASHVLYVGMHARNIEKIGAQTFGQTPLEAIKYSMDRSFGNWAWLVDGTPGAIGGLIVVSALGGIAYAWIVTTDLVDEHKLAYARMTRRMKLAAHETFPTIIGEVHAIHTDSLKWIQWLGLKVRESRPGVYEAIT